MGISSNLLKTIDLGTWFPSATLFSFFNRIFPKSQKDRKIAVVRPGGLGDLVLLTMAIRDGGFNLAEFRFFIQKRAAPWAEYLKLDYIIVDDDLRDLTFHRGRYVQVINTEQLFGLATSFSVYIAHTDCRVSGFNTNRGQKYLTVVCPFDENGTHEKKSFSNLLQSHFSLRNELGAPFGIQSGREILDYSCLSISGLESPSRNLSVDAWIKLITANYLGGEIRILSAPSERQKAEEIRAALSIQNIQSQIESGNFSQQIDILIKAKRLIGMDGGMVHVASYFNVPSTVIFTSGQDYKWAPLTPGSLVLKRKDLSCQPCNRFGQVPPCPNGLICRDADEILKQSIPEIPR